MEFEVALLEFAQLVINKEYDNAVAKGKEIAELIDEENREAAKDTLNALLDNNLSIPEEKIDEIIDSFRMDKMDAFKAMIHFQYDASDGITVEEFKASDAYTMLESGSVVFDGELEKAQYLRLLVNGAIATRDSGLIKYMLDKIQELES